MPEAGGNKRFLDRSPWFCWAVEAGVVSCCLEDLFVLLVVAHLTGSVVVNRTAEH